MDEEQKLKRAYRNGWIVVGVATVFTILFCLFVFVLNRPDKPVKWDMGGEPFVPASSKYGVEYYAPGPPNYQPAVRPAR